MRSSVPGTILFALLALACSRKAEVLPDGATHIARTDSSVENGNKSYELRSYTFKLRLPEGEASFFCETKKFSSTTDALEAAEKSIAQRPDAQQKKSSAWYARAGLSQWLLTDKIFTWCMLSSTGNSLREAAQMKLRETFLRKFSEA